MSLKKLRVGLIGAGGIVRGAHLNPGWKAVPNVEIVAVCDVRKEAAEALAKDFGIPQAFTDFRDLVKLDLDCVDICTPNRVHTPAVLAALKTGKHVLCEKPLAVTTQEVQSMALAARKSKRLLMTAQHFRFTDAITALKRYVEAGGAGDFYHARVHALRRNWLPLSPGFIDPKLSGGGPCMDIGVHALDSALHLMGFPKPVRVTGKTAVNFAKGDVIPGGWGEWDRKLFGVEDFASGFVHFDNGATMVLEAAWLGHQKTTEDFSFTLFGKQGSVAWPSNETFTCQNRAVVSSHVQPTTGLQKPHTEEILAFVRAIREDLPSPVPVEQTLYVIAILEGIYRSAKVGREINIKL
jgi:predicted dehydrogenase